MNENALAKTTPAAALALKPAKTLIELAERFQELNARGHLLSPIIAVDNIPAFHQVSLRAVVVDPTIPARANGDSGMGTGPECYRDPRFCDKDEVALGKNAILKIMAAAGIQCVETKRIDDRKDPYYCEIQVRLAWTDLDGLYQERTASKVLDLRDGSPATMQPEKDAQGKKTGQMVPMQPTAIADKRRNIASLCETEAVLRGVRSILSLAQKYKVADLQKPFFVPKLVPHLDTADPDQKAVALSRLGASSAALYGRPAAQERPMRAVDAAPVHEAEVVDLETGEIHEAEAQPDAAEPWESQGAAQEAQEEERKPLGLPMDKAALAALPADRRAWFVRLSEISMEVYDKFGPDLGYDHIAAALPEGYDPATCPATEVAKIAAALKAALGR